MIYNLCRNTHLGFLTVRSDGENIVSVAFEKCEGNDNLPLLEEAFKQLNEYFEGRRKEFSLPIKPKGTAFMQKVWEEVKKIPYGQTASYEDIALRTGNKRACRAVGMANNKNPVCILIPCHRVVGKNGKLTGYAFGNDIKAKLLEIEKLK